MSYQTGTLYQFTEIASEVLVARTTDIRELINFIETDWMEIGKMIKINGKRYEVLHIVIEPFPKYSQLFKPTDPDTDFGEEGYWSVSTRIYLSPPKK